MTHAAVWRGGALLVVLIVLGASAGCAARAPRFADRFVHAGEPAVERTGELPAPLSEDALSSYISKVRALQAAPRTRAAMLPTIESNSPALSRALLLLALDESATSHRRVASAYLDAGIRDYAFRHYQRAVALAPCDAVAHDGLARLWRDWRMPAQALEEAHRGLRCDPQSAALQNTLGTILQDIGQLDPAGRAYRRALALDPSSGFALNNLCYLEIRRQRPAAAAPLCEAALAAAPGLTAARNNLALARTLAGAPADAEATLSAADAAPTSTYNLGVLRFSDGRFAAAARAFDAAADAAPSLAWLARLRAVQSRRAALAAAGQAAAVR